MADAFVSSPRRTLSLAREKASVAISDDDRENRLRLAHKAVAKVSEVYGFVGSISTIVAAGLFFVWAYLPEAWLHYLGITYYPSRYWALAIPAYVMVSLVLLVIFYLSCNCMLTVHPASWNSIFDEHTADGSSIASTNCPPDQECLIDPISDIPIIKVNTHLFESQRFEI